MNSFNAYRYWAIKGWADWSKRWPLYLAGSSAVELVTLVFGYVPTTASLIIGCVTGGCMFAKTLCDLYVRNVLGVVSVLGSIMPFSMYIEKAARNGEFLLPLVSVFAIALIYLSLLHGFVGPHIHPDISLENDASPQINPPRLP